MKAILLLSIFLTATICNAQIKEFRTTIYFDNNQSTLTNNAKLVLDSLKNLVTGRKVIDYTIKGFADNIGTDFSNEVLSYKRAGNVEKWLEQNIENGELYFSKGKVHALGEDDPITKNRTEEERAVNRRAVVTINVDYTPFISNTQLNKKHHTSPQKFCIYNQKDTLLICNQGTMVYVKANSFQNANTSQCINIEIREANTMSDILKNNLTTNNDNNILYSQSMVEVMAKQNNKSLQLISGKDYIIFSPTNENVQNADVYNGNVDGIGNINWEKGNSSTLQQIKATDFSNCNGNRFRCGGVRGTTPDCSECKLVFCGLGKIIKYSFEENGKQKRKQYNDCRKNKKQLRKFVRTNTRNEKYRQQMANLQDKITPLEQCYLPEAGSCGMIVNKYDLNCVVDFEKKVKESLQNLQKNGNGFSVQQLNNLQYAIFSRNQVGWSNIDWMLKVSPSQRADLYVDLETTPNTEAKIIFTKYKTVLRAEHSKNGNFIFPDMPQNEEASLLIVDTRTGSNSILVQKIDITTKGQTIIPRFVSASLNDYTKILESFQ